MTISADPSVDLALVSDIDDTVMVTALPRPLLAAWNTFVAHPVFGVGVGAACSATATAGRIRIFKSESRSHHI